MGRGVPLVDPSGHAVVVHFQRFPQVEHLLDLLGVLVRLAFTSIRPQIRKLHMKKPADLLQGLFRPLIGFLEAGLQPAAERSVAHARALSHLTP